MLGEVGQRLVDRRRRAGVRRAQEPIERAPFGDSV
jgi:hypothetical protein